MCHGIPRGQLLLREEIAQALLDADDGRAEPDTAAPPVADVDADEADADTPSYLIEEAADANALTGAMSTDDPFDGGGPGPR